MGNIRDIKYFKDTSRDYTSENLSNLIFKGLDYRDKEPISFFRSDFSKSQIVDCFFTNNNFGRVDFISSYISHTTFTTVDFGSCLMKNTTFEDVCFNNNHYHGVAIQYSYFKDCTFYDESIITNMYNTVFDNCRFINCKFEKSSLDNNTYVNCHLENVDISECIAENLKFDKCKLDDVFLGSSLWPTYLYKNTTLANCKFKYRGEIIDIWKDEKMKFARLKEEERYFEFLNTILVSQLYKDDFYQVFCETISLVLLQNFVQRKDNLTKILEMLIFYCNTSYIPIVTFFKIFNFLKNHDWSSFEFEERIIYESEIYKIERIIDAFDFLPNLLLETPLEEKCICKFHLRFENKNDAQSYLKELFESVNECYFNNIYITPLFTVISEEKGSIILSVATAAALALLVSYVIKKISHNIIGIRVEKAISQKLIEAINSEEGNYSKINESLELAKKYDYLDDDDLSSINKISKNMTVDNIIDVILKFLF